MQRRLCVLGTTVLLLAACGGGADDPGDAAQPADEPAAVDETVDDGDAESEEQDEDGQDDAEAEEGEEAAAEPAEDDTDVEATDTDEASEDGGPGDRLVVALARVDDMVGDDADAADDHCEPLSDWATVEATLGEHLEDSALEDSSWEARGGELVQFGCGFGWHTQGEGFGGLAILVSVYASPAELPADFQETSTAGGLTARSGQGEIEDDLVWMSGGPVSAAVTVVGNHELRVTAEPEVLAPEELLALLDAAWEDLGELV